MDIVVTVPKTVWLDWLAEGDCAGEPETGEEWGFHVSHHPSCVPGNRLYIVAWGRLRGYAPVTRIARTPKGWAICRKAGAVAVTIEEPIRGFRGRRFRWWNLEAERPFPNWKTEGVG